jgi:glyoxylase-like metal-dependent hydrolase (beta-lactamase superfamily II)
MEVKRLVIGDFNTNCYFLVLDKEIAIIDAGGQADKILQALKGMKTKVKYIISTHYHFDHVIANERIKRETGAKILIHEDEKKFIGFEPDRFLKDGDEINLNGESLKVIHTPGHTRGSICLHIKNIIFSGDTLFRHGYGRADLPGGSMEQLRDSLDRLSDLLKPGMTIYPGHGEPFKV